MPRTNGPFWAMKFEQNQRRDRTKARQLRQLGYRVLTVWECQLESERKLARLVKRLNRHFGDSQ